MNNINNNTNTNNKLWLNDPMILVDKNELLNLWPAINMSREDKINSISRLVFLLTFFGFLLFRSFKILITGFITIVILLITYYALNNKDSNNNIDKKNKEGFSNELLYQKFKSNYTNPDANNPMMNIFLKR